MAATVSLAHMVDLALGTPEVGTVNFNVLHTLLHAMLTKLDLSNITTELSSEDHDLLANRNGEKTADSTTIGGKDADNIAKTEKDVQRGQGGGVVSKRSPYHVLQSKVAVLEEQMQKMNDLPSNSDLFEGTKPVGEGERPRPVASMWQNVQLKNRVDANEEGIGKLMSLVEEMMAELNTVKADSNSLRTDLDNLTNRMNNMPDLDELRKRLNELETLANSLNNQLSKYPDPMSFNDYVTWKSLEESLKGLRAELEPKDRIVIEMQTQTSRPASAKEPPRIPSPKGPSEELQQMLESIGLLTNRHDKVEVRVDKLEEELPNKADKADLTGLSTDVPDDLLAQLKDLQDQLKALGKAKDKDSEALNRLQQIVLQLQTELDRLQQTANILSDENNNKTKQIEDLLNTSDKLERIKADKEYVQNEVDVKADKRLVEGKVNRSLFDQTTDELNKMIKELLDNLSGKEDEWKQTLGSMTDDVDGKLDRLEFGPIRDELERRLKALARQLRELSLRDGDMEDDAAGIRRQLIQRYHCISCDRPVDMMPQGPIPSIPIPQGMPATRSSRPYTTFELEQIRQHARSLQQPGVEVTDLYATTRACGGTHTVTQPHRRVTRVTQFNNLFRDEEVAPPPVVARENPHIGIEELDITGADGQVYKGRIEARFPTTLQQSAPGVLNGPQHAGQSPKMTRKYIYAQAAPRPPATAPPTASPPASTMMANRSPRPSSAGRTIKPSPVNPKQATIPTAGTNEPAQDINT